MATVKEPAELRRIRLIKLVEDGDFISPADMARKLRVSGETIRRDLLVLEQSGQLRRFHGGAVAGEVKTSEPDRASRSRLNRTEKKEIAEIAVSLIGPTDAIFLDVGTTVEAIAKALPHTFCGTVVTNNLLVTSILGDRENIDLYVLGGKVRAGEFTTFGADTLTQINGFNTNLAFISAGGVHASEGLTDYSTGDIALKRAMISNTRATYIVAGSEKLGQTALRNVSSIVDVSAVITDSKIGQQQLDDFSAAGIKVLHPAP